MEFDYSDRRKHQRVDIEQAIYVEVVKRGSRSEADNTIIRCETADISAAVLMPTRQETVPATRRPQHCFVLPSRPPRPRTPARPWCPRRARRPTSRRQTRLRARLRARSRMMDMK